MLETHVNTFRKLIHAREPSIEHWHNETYGQILIFLDHGQQSATPKRTELEAQENQVFGTKPVKVQLSSCRKHIGLRHDEGSTYLDQSLAKQMPERTERRWRLRRPLISEKRIPN